MSKKRKTIRKYPCGYEKTVEAESTSLFTYLFQLGATIKHVKHGDTYGECPLHGKQCPPWTYKQEKEETKIIGRTEQQIKDEKNEAQIRREEVELVPKNTEKTEHLLKEGYLKKKIEHLQHKIEELEQDTEKETENIEDEKEEEDVFECPYCGETWDSKASLGQHKRYCKPGKNREETEDNLEDYICPWCEEEFGAQPTLSQHTKKEHKGKKKTAKFKCKQCGDTYNTEPQAASHIAMAPDHEFKGVSVYHNVEVTNTDAPDKLTNNKPKQENNVGVGKGSICGECGADFPNKKQLREHRDRQH